MTRNLFVAILVILVLGALGGAGLIAYQRTAQENYLEKLHMGEAMIRQQEWDSAINVLLPIVQKGRRFEQSDKAMALLIEAYDGGGHKEADELRKKMVKDFPKSPYTPAIHLELAKKLIETNPSEARAIYNQIIETHTGPPVFRARLGLAKLLDRENQVDRAMEMYYELIDSATEFDVISEAKDRVSEINTQRLWSPALDPFCELYIVQRGDVAVSIGQNFKTTAWFVTEANNVKAGRLQPGMRLKVPKEPFHIIVNKAQCRLDLRTESGTFIKWYKVGVGEQSYKTPAGDYQIINKEINPKWYKPGGGVVPALDPENALGTRWMGIGSSLGIHGTNAPETIGYPKSAGCIRMFNHDAEELYKLVTYGTRVTIIEGTEPEQPHESETT